MSKFPKVAEGTWAYHVVVWILLITPSLVGSTYLLPLGVLGYSAALFGRVSATLVLVYVNFFLLIPRLLRRRRYVLFVVCLVALMAINVSVTSLIDVKTMQVLGRRELSTSEVYFEMLFYFFNAGSYVLTSFLLFQIKEKAEQKKRLDEVQVEKLKTEVNYLRAQINPHFLFNTLNNLYGLVLEKSDKSGEIVLKLSKIMDYMLYESSDEKVYLAKDLDNLESYVDIERIRQGNNARINFEIQGIIDGQRIVPLLLLPLIENAFKHGVNDQIDGAFLDAIVTVDKNSVTMAVRNSYRAAQEQQVRHGIGLTNLRKRLELFYPGRHQLQISQADREFEVKLHLQLS